MKFLVGFVVGIIVAEVGTEKFFDLLGTTLQQLVNIIKSFV